MESVPDRLSRRRYLAAIGGMGALVRCSGGKRWRGRGLGRVTHDAHDRTGTPSSRRASRSSITSSRGRATTMWAGEDRAELPQRVHELMVR